MYGITFNNKHSFRDFNIKVLNTREIKTPSKRKILETIPFFNGDYDFSNLYGGTTYDNRQLVYEFIVRSSNQQQLEYKRMNIENWLMGTNEKTKLIDDNTPNFYYLAECIDLDFEDMYVNGTIKATFDAYPFRIGANYEGNNLWDNFNFESDVLQDTKFTVNGYANVNIYNSSAIDIEPAIIASSEFEIIKDSKKFIVEAGESKDYRFKLKKGENNITLKGNGTIEFRFRKEVL